MYRYIRHISTMLAAVAMTAMLGSCSTEDIDAPRAQESYTPGTQLVINLAVPETMETASAAESRTAGNDENYMDPTGNEGKINSLRLMGFLRDGSLAFNRTLLIPSEMPVNPNGTAIYEIRDVRPGDYHLYLVANLDEYVKNVANEAALKQVIVNMDAQHPLTSGNLPMVYEPDHYVTIPESASTNPDVELLSLKFACVKVKYDLLFDKAWNSDIFGNNGMVINDVTVSNVATSAYLVTNKTQHAQTRDGVSGNGSHYDSYTETPANASKPNVNVIGVSGKVSRPTAPTTKWAYEGILYLPERYATDKQTTLNISATVTDPSGADGTVTSRYTILLGGYDDDEDCKELPRGTYYEVIAKIKTLGDAELDATIVTKDWMESKLSVDMVHTYLTLSKDAAEVESLKEDVISYDTDGRGTIGFECVTKLPTNSVISYDVIQCVPDYNAKTLTFKVNPDIDIATLPTSQQEGTAECYITAGNIRKLIRIKYDIKPFFTITPLAVKIQWNTEYQGIMNTKIFEYETNLRGIEITELGNRANIKISKTRAATGDKSECYDVIGNSNIKLSFSSDATYSKGKILVEAKADPLTTTLHYFGAYPNASAYASLKQDLQVTVMPPLGDYRIYFRAINDYQKYNGGDSNVSGEWLEGNDSMTDTYYPAEYRGIGDTNNNWIDYWYCNKWNTLTATENGRNNSVADSGVGGYQDYTDPKTHYYAQKLAHRIYIWTQYGETTGSETNQPAWEFTSGGYVSSPGMEPDLTNPGWYYYNLGVKAPVVGWTHNASGQKPVEPGKVLMIFDNHTNADDQGYTIHRVSHHLEAGIPLFDYEDREGWILYDPTAEPIYRLYDEKPYIEDVIFTVYSKDRITGWEHQYGVAEKKVATATSDVKKFKIYSKRQSQTQKNFNGTLWWEYKFRLKCAYGDYEKAIKLNGLTGGSSTSVQQRVYYRKDNGGWDYPRVYIYNNSSDKMTEWANAPTMSLLSGSSNIYYYDVPANYYNGYVIFRSNNGSEQYPYANQPGLSLGGHSMMLQSGNKNWDQYGQQPTGPVSTDVILFGGRSFANYGHIGTYDNGVWTGGQPK